MEILLLFFIAAYGMSNILVYGSIFESTRNFITEMGSIPYLGFIFKFVSDLLGCMMCTSTWVGFFFGLFVMSPFMILVGVNPSYSWFFDGMLASGAVWGINSIVEWFEENR
jgi:hypothetical protein